MKNTFIIFFVMIFAAACSSKDIDEMVTFGEKQSKTGVKTSTQNYLQTVTVSTVAELTTAIANLTEGTRIIIENNIYSDINLTINAVGSQSNPILIESETLGGVTFDGTSQLKVRGDYISLKGINFPTGDEVFIDEGNYNEYQYCKFDNSTGDISGHVMRLEGTHTSVHHCTFNGKTTSGNYINVIVDENVGSFHKIYRNTFSRPNGSGNGRSAMRIGHGTMATYDAYVLVERNLFDACDGESEIVSVKSSSNYIRNNTFRMCRGHLSLRQGDGSVVEGNFFIGDGAKKCGGIAVRGDRHFIFNNYFSGIRDVEGGVMSFGVADDIDPDRVSAGLPGRKFGLTTNIVVCFNTIMNHKSICDYDFLYGYGSRNRTHVPNNIYMYNNVSDNSSLFANGVSDVQNLVMQSNYFSGKKKNNGGANVISFIMREVQVAGITIPKANSSFKNQSVALPSNPSQPLLAAANFSGRDLNVNKDVFGLARDADKDSGCFELGAAGNRTNEPLSANDAGCGY
ncbi:MAG: polysaccharide lyase 6 family protein [Marinifilum sp.]|jgi:poly(beta-D-mannuronate) lyase|nr:polysaccharide lyase 6 family protein [Marinifilum sp.]